MYLFRLIMVARVFQIKIKKNVQVAGMVPPKKRTQNSKADYVIF